MTTKYVEKALHCQEAKLIPVGDIHLGDPSCDTKLLEGTIDYIKNSKDTISIGMGDYMNCATTTSVSDTYLSKMTPQQEYNAILEYLTPIKHKLVGLLIGNHEWRVWKESGVNLVKTLAKDLEIPYLGWAVFLKVSVGTNPDPRRNQSYVIYATHGNSSAWTPEGKIRAVRRLAEGFNADVYLMGHLHDVAVEIDERLAVDKRLKCTKRKKSYYVITGHFLDYQDSYAEMKAMKPSKKGVPKIKLYGDRYDMHVSV